MAALSIIMSVLSATQLCLLSISSGDIMNFRNNYNGSATAGEKGFWQQSWPLKKAP